MTKGQAVKLREKWEQQVGRQPCKHPDLEVEHSEDGIVTATYHCLTCGNAVVQID
jgi:hypothetical protein